MCILSVFVDAKHYELRSDLITAHRTLLQVFLMNLLCLAQTSCQALVGVPNNTHDAGCYMGLTLHPRRTSLLMRER